MICTTFHPFPNLPFEVRLLIWEAACLEHCPRRRGIHYVADVSNGVMSPLSYNWDESKPKNRSMYLWDAGLWTTCRESREVVFKQWRKLPTPTNDHEKGLCCSEEENNLIRYHSWSEEKDDDDWGFLMLSSRIHHEHWRQIVDLYRDIFCITTDDWEFPDRHGWAWGFRPENMAVEFNPSWNEALAEQPWDSPDENLSGSLNFVIELLYHKVSERIDYKTKIIDRHAKWASRYPPIGPTFHGCDGEYIEIPLQHWQRWRRCSIRLVEGSALLDFFDYFVSLFYFRLQEIYCNTHGLSFDWESDMEERDKFDIRDHFSILVLQRNQVDYVQD
ncbi:uncharacterized protein B0J16DRAFT_401371 [Fusarium flagelliforme]|uniref:uncharacterized protein n=1 Tax=Fusarium flagelliforme TaxID=2675880 RepID=UPI001E8CAFAC|nr:uncharacterized protein B0J16DRAFT_401371 [Fusarium flagelliforme]KAH7183163.1 hypothetical protein B0J16DRAFT_401371 [Fusarium flagelliforme]